MRVYCRLFGIPLTDGGTVRLPRLVGQGCALEIIMTGSKVEAEECLRIGPCEIVVPKGQARQSAESMAQEISRFPQACVRADRRSVYLQYGQNQHFALIQEWHSCTGVFMAEGAVGAAKFVDGYARHGDFGKSHSLDNSELSLRCIVGFHGSRCVRRTYAVRGKAGRLHLYDGG